MSAFHVHAFRGLRELSTQLKPITLVGGRNGVGKTSFLEAAYLAATDVDYEKLQQLEQQRSQPDRSAANVFESSGSETKPAPMWNLLFPLDGEAEVSLGYHNGESNHFGVRLFEPNRALELDKRLRTRLENAGWTGGSREHFLVAETGCPNGVDHKHWSVFRADGNSWNHFSQQKHAPHAEGAGGVRFVQATGWAATSQLAADYSGIVRDSRSELLLEVMQEMDSRVSGLEILDYRGRYQLHLLLGRSVVPISYAGEGLVRIAAYLAAIVSTQDGVVLIDEMENGIHYSALPTMWRAIDKASQVSRCQVIATTHSDEFLISGAEAISDDRFAYLRLDRKSDGDVVATQYSSTEAVDSLQLGIRIR